MSMSGDLDETIPIGMPSLLIRLENACLGLGRAARIIKAVSTGGNRKGVPILEIATQPC
jgi:hypothetical protein